MSLSRRSVAYVLDMSVGRLEGMGRHEGKYCYLHQVSFAVRCQERSYLDRKISHEKPCAVSQKACDFIYDVHSHGILIDSVN